MPATDKTPSEAANALLRSKSQRILDRHPGSPSKEQQQTSKKVVKSPAKETRKQHPAKDATEDLPSGHNVDGGPPIEDTLIQGEEQRLSPQENTVTNDVTGEGTKDPNRGGKGAV